MLPKLRFYMIAILVFALGSAGAAHSYAAPQGITLVLSSPAEPYQQVVTGIKDALFSRYPELPVTILALETATQRTAQAWLNEQDLVVAVGSSATHYILQQPLRRKPLVTFVTQSAVQGMLIKHGQHHQLALDLLSQAVVLDQPGSRLVALARLIVPHSQRLGTIVNGEESNRLDEFELAAAEQQLTLQAATLFEETNPIKQLKSVFAQSDVFLVIPDKAQFNSKVAKWILFLSYRQGVPVIGYSQKYTEAGALVSLYSTPYQIGLQTGQILLATLMDNQSLLSKNKVLYPRYFEVSVNQQVSASLGITTDEQLLMEKLLDREGHQNSAIEEELSTLQDTIKIIR